jgi:hypothetical protein
VITAVAFQYISTEGGDSYFYWFQSSRSAGTIWSDWFPLGNGVMIWLNYFPAKVLNFPFWLGFYGYSFIGFLGIFQFYRLGKVWVRTPVKVFGCSLLILLLFLPNFHFWTGHISKEVWCFLWISTILLKLHQRRFKSWQLWLCSFLLLMLRPHVALMLAFPIGVAYVFFGNLKLKKKVLIGVLGSLFLGIAFYGFLLLAGFWTFDWEKLREWNDYSILSFQRADSYVPMLDYNYPMKLFSFYFRPLFFDAQDINGWVLSLENAITLLAHILGLALIVRFYKRIEWDRLSQIILLYVLVAGLIYVQRYAALGIFVRTKIMIQPFVMLLILKVAGDVFNFQIKKR